MYEFEEGGDRMLHHFKLMKIGDIIGRGLSGENSEEQRVFVEEEISVILKNYAQRAKEADFTDQESQIVNLTMLEKSLNPREIVHKARESVCIYEILASSNPGEGSSLKEESHDRANYLTETAR